MTPEEQAAFISAILASVTGGGNKDKDTKTVSKDILTIDNAAARTLLEQMAKSAQYQGKLTKDDVTQFVNQFNAAAKAQADEAVRVVTERIQPGAKPEDITKIVNTYVTTTGLSFLDPKALASDFIWSKINFADEKTLGGNARKALQDVRALVRNNGIMDISDIEIQNAARKIARGELRLDEFQATLANKTIMNYPQFADRFKNNPGATARDIFSPYITTMAKVLEMDPNSINLDNPYLDKALRPDGAAGKMPPMSIPDFAMFLKNTPEAENTIQANEAARSAATSFARAWGFGV